EPARPDELPVAARARPGGDERLLSAARDRGGRRADRGRLRRAVPADAQTVREERARRPVEPGTHRWSRAGGGPNVGPPLAVSRNRYYAVGCNATSST